MLYGIGVPEFVFTTSKPAMMCMPRLSTDFARYHFCPRLQKDTSRPIAARGDLPGDRGLAMASSIIPERISSLITGNRLHQLCRESPT